MKRVLLTGMSGTGKSTLIRELATRGYRAIDADTDEWSEWVSVSPDADLVDAPADPASVWESRDWVWREERIARLLSAEDTELLFMAGTAPNQGKFHVQFSHIVLLSAPVGVLVERLATRTTNSYGKHPYELARVLDHVRTVEPLLRRAASVEVDTSPPIDQVIDTILDIART